VIVDQALAERLASTGAHLSVSTHRSARRRRALLVTAALGGVACALFVITMTIGSYHVSPWEVVASTLHLEDDPAIDFVVRELRLPTALTGLAVGLALGVSGLIFQRLLANPLASPDFVGVSSGASLFAVSAIILLDFGSAGISLAALAGALTSAALVYVLAWRDGISGYRFILIGIGVSEFMLSIVGYIVAKANIYDAREAMTWLVGSVGQAGSGELRALVSAVAILLPVALILDRQLRALELGDDAARALGARVESCRLGLIAVSIMLVAFATAAAGPIMFVALIAGPIARRLLGPAPGDIVAAAFVGAIIVLASDLVADHALPVSLPTGVITGAIGAPYLIWLLATANREGRGG
jgi:iron complex transport system permease protein